MKNRSIVHSLFAPVTPLLLLLAAMLSTGCGGGASEPAPAATAEEAVMRIAKGMQENKPVVVWQALPASYQKDVHDLVHEAIGKVDPKAWEGIVTTAESLHKILSSKKEFIVNHPAIKGMVGPDAGKIIDGIVPVLGEILASDLASHSKAKAIDLGSFLDKTGSRIMGQIVDTAKLTPMGAESPEAFALADKFKQLKATKVSGEGDAVVLKLEVPGEEPKEMPFVRVEGKWIPKDIADGWKENMKKAREELAARTDKEWMQNNTMIITMTSMVGGLIKPLEEAKTQEEFNNAVDALMNMMGGGAGPGGPGGPNGF